MSTRTLRLMKEARPLLWPWIAVSVMGTAPLLFGRIWIGPLASSPLRHLAPFTILGALVGIPLLATLPFSVEFQHRTMSVLLAQPEDRAKIWAWKVIVALPFALSAAAVYYAAWDVVMPADPGKRLVWPLLLLLTMCSAAYWTLVGKSTLTGLMLNLLTSGVLIVIMLFYEAIGRPLLPGTVVASTVTIVALALAGYMAWLGRRRFVQFESIGTVHSTDLMAGNLGGVLRAAPTNAVRNLVKKELHLLAPVWVLSLIAIGFMGVLTLLKLVAAASNQTLATIVSLLGAAIAGIAIEVAPILAGTLSVSEEKNTGTQIWNLVLPLSIRRQWRLKFLLGLLTCLASQALVLLAMSLIGEKLFPPEVIHLSTTSLIPLSLCVISIATFVFAFWSACVMNETLRAALLIFPLAGLLGAAGALGSWLGSSWVIVNFYGLLLARFHPYPYSISSRVFEGLAMVSPFVLILPVLGLMIFQGFGMFRRDAVRSDWSFVRRRLLILAMVAILSGGSITASRYFLYGPRFQEWSVMAEVHDTVVQLYVNAGSIDDAHPIRVTAEDFAKLPGLSAVSRIWVRNSSIAIFPLEKAALAQLGPRTSPYYVSVRYASGRECRGAGGSYWWCVEPKGFPGGFTGNGPGPFMSAILVAPNIAETLVISKEPPLPPSAAVSLKILVGQDGRVEWVRPVSGEEPSLSAAVKAVEQWRYQPLHMLGWPAKFVTSVRVGPPGPADIH